MVIAYVKIEPYEKDEFSRHYPNDDYVPRNVKEPYIATVYNDNTATVSYRDYDYQYNWEEFKLKFAEEFI